MVNMNIVWRVENMRIVCIVQSMIIICAKAFKVCALQTHAEVLDIISVPVLCEYFAVPLHIIF